ncbi:MAG: chemotaxis protein CheD [Solirubrobacterales bacterium]|jgi:chemotaxis protein CheD|nr:chemotaxis protein CheD [Solirubrobacterales bacterium]
MSAEAELPARMGEWVIGTEPGTVLSCVGLGSCIGLALLDRRGGMAGLAHVMLPESPAAGPPPAQPGKFADLAVPALVEGLLAAGGMRHRLEAVLVGGARMFSFTAVATQDIGCRNEAAVREQLTRARIRICATATGGDKGRTVRVIVATGEVVCHEAAGETVTLVPAMATRWPVAVPA